MPMDNQGEIELKVINGIARGQSVGLCFVLPDQTTSMASRIEF
jgi:hypothetical protein